MFPVSSCCCLCPINWSQLLSQEWRYSWSSADRLCSNCILVIHNFIACWGAPCMRGLTVRIAVALIFSAFPCATDLNPYWRISPKEVTFARVSYKVMRAIRVMISSTQSVSFLDHELESRGPFYQCRWTQIRLCVSNCIHRFMWM